MNDYTAILTKVRAMRSQLLSPEDIQNNPNLKKPEDIYQLLQKTEGYNRAIREIDMTEFTPKTIIPIINNGVYYTFLKLYRFANLKQRSVLKLYGIKYEEEFIKRIINNLQADKTSNIYFKGFTDYLEKSRNFIPGVRIVIDAGLDRQSRLDTVRGVSGLVTVGAAKSAMTQRAGRAAREAPGLVVRCLSDADFAARPTHTPAEIRTADLTQTVLDLARWGAADGAGLRLPEPMPARTFATAVDVLTHLGALDGNSSPNVTELGRKLAQ